MVNEIQEKLPVVAPLLLFLNQILNCNERTALYKYMFTQQAGNTHFLIV